MKRLTRSFPLLLGLVTGLACDLPGTDDPSDPMGPGTDSDAPSPADGDSTTGDPTDPPDETGDLDDTTGADEPTSDGPLTCSTGRVFMGNPIGDPAARPASGDPMLNAEADGPSLPVRTIATVPGRPDAMIVAIGPELWAVDRTTQTVHRILGDASADEFRAGACSEARLGIVSDIAFRSDGRLYAGDHSGNAVVEIIDPLEASCEMRYYAGTQQAVNTSSLPYKSGNVDGDAAVARFAGPDWITVDDDDNIWVVDKGNRSIRKIDTDDQVTTVAQFHNAYVGPSGAVSVFEIVAHDGKLYMPAKGSLASAQNATVLEYDIAGGSFTELVTGRDDPWLVGNSGPAIAAMAHAGGDQIVTWVNGRLFSIDVRTGDVEHIAGDGSKPWALAEFAPGYDPFAEHDAMEVELDDMSATVTGASGFVHYADGHLYFSAHAYGYYVMDLACQ
jgi:hypothetical protein